MTGQSLKEAIVWTMVAAMLVTLAAAALLLAAPDAAQAASDTSQKVGDEARGWLTVLFLVVAGFAALPTTGGIAQQHLGRAAHAAGPIAPLAPVRRAGDLAQLQRVGVALGGLPAREFLRRERRLEPRPQRRVRLEAVGAPVQHHHREADRDRDPVDRGRQRRSAGPAMGSLATSTSASATSTA